MPISATSQGTTTPLQILTLERLVTEARRAYDAGELQAQNAPLGSTCSYVDDLGYKCVIGQALDGPVLDRIRTKSYCDERGGLDHRLNTCPVLSLPSQLLGFQSKSAKAWADKLQKAHDEWVGVVGEEGQEMAEANFVKTLCLAERSLAEHGARLESAQ